MDAKTYRSRSLLVAPKVGQLSIRINGRDAPILALLIGLSSESILWLGVLCPILFASTSRMGKPEASDTKVIWG